MAVEVEAGSQVEEFLRVLRRRIWWIIVPAATCIAIATCFGIIVPKKYVVKTRVMVRNTLTGMPGASRGSNSAKQATVASHEILSNSRIKGVLQELRWPEYMMMGGSDQHDYVTRQKERVSVVIPRMEETGQQVVRMSYSHTEPDRAVEFLVKLREKWQNEVLERGRTAEQNAYDQLNDDRTSLELRRNDLMEESVRLRKEFHIAPTQQWSRGQPARDNVLEQQADLEKELADLELEVEQLERELEDSVKQYNTLPQTVLRTQTEEGLVFRRQIQEKREEIQTLTQALENSGYKPRHPKHKLLQSQIEQLQEDIRFLKDSEVRGSEKELWVANPKWEDLGRKIEGDRKKLAFRQADKKAINRRLAELNERAHSLQEAYGRIHRIDSDLALINEQLSDVERRLLQKKATVQWLTGPAGNPFEILEEVTTPTDPTEPNPILIAIFGVFVGLGIGLSLAVVVEYSKNCFRSVHDISRVMVVPVLGTINAITTKRETRRVVATRMVMGGAAFMLISMLGYVTWAYKMSPNLLSNQVLETIESFRSHFK